MCVPHMHLQIVFSCHPMTAKVLLAVGLQTFFTAEMFRAFREVVPRIWERGSFRLVGAVLPYPTAVQIHRAKHRANLSEPARATVCSDKAPI